MRKLKNDEYLLADNMSDARYFVMKLQNNNDGSKTMVFENDHQEFHRYKFQATKQSEIGFQFQKPLVYKNKVITATINDEKGTLQWNIIALPGAEGEKDWAHKGIACNSQQIHFQVDFPVMCVVK